MSKIEDHTFQIWSSFVSLRGGQSLLIECRVSLILNLKSIYGAYWFGIAQAVKDS